MTRVFISHAPLDDDLAYWLSSALEEMGMSVLRLDALGSVGDWQAEMLSAIKRCDVFVAIIGKSLPNVLFELGCAIGSNATVLLIRRSSTDLPFDISSFPTITVEPFDNRAIAEAVEWIRNSGVRKPSPSMTAGNPREVLERLARDPTLLDEMQSRLFEESVGKYLEYRRIPVETGGSGPDQGYDFAIRGFAGRELIIVEVKKYNRNSRISLSEAQRVLGVAVASNADGAMIVSSGHFTPSARYFANAAPIRMILLPIAELLELNQQKLIQKFR